MSDKNMHVRRILVAGGSSGMGLALAERLIEAGDHVTIVGRDATKLRRVQDDLGTPQRLATVAADITIESEVQALFSGSGPLDHIVCTAADFTAAYQLLSGSI